MQSDSRWKHRRTEQPVRFQFWFILWLGQAFVYSSISVEQQRTLPLAGQEVYLLHKFASEIRALGGDYGHCIMYKHWWIWSCNLDSAGWAVSVDILNPVSQRGGFCSAGNSNVTFVWCNLVIVLVDSVWIECQECICFLYKCPKLL